MLNMNQYFWPLTANNISFTDRAKLSWYLLNNNYFTSGGPLTKEFEKKFASWLGVKHAIFTSSGGTANLLALAATAELYEIRKEGKIIVPACTWPTGVNPVIQLGFEPIFCDVSLYNYGLVPHIVSELCEKHDIKAIFMAHLLGLPTNTDAIKKASKNTIILEDVCESLGAYHDASLRKVGTAGLASTFSFYYSHHITTIEGGMVCTNDDELNYILRSKKENGYAQENPYGGQELLDMSHNKPFVFITDGYNFKNTEIGAKLGLLQMKKLDNIIQVRKRNYKTFHDTLTEFDSYFYVSTNNIHNNSSFCFPILCKDNQLCEELKAVFTRYSIEHRPIVAGNLLRQPYLRKYAEQSEPCPNAEIIHNNGFYIGNHVDLNSNHFRVLTEILHKVINRRHHDV